MSNVTKLYACFKAGFLGSNILDTYFSFVANIIIDNSINTIEDSVIQAQFKERYSIELPLPFIRQVLERMTVNHDVTGSSPVGGAKNSLQINWC